MRHEWIFDVLTDLRSYAQKNGLPALAAQVEEALRIARTEIAAQDQNGGPSEAGDSGHGGLPGAGRAH